MEQEKDQIAQWKQYIQEYQQSKKILPFEYQLNKKITHREVKQREQEFHPILQLFNSQEAEDADIKKKKDKIQQSLVNYYKPIEKYQKAYDIVNLEKNDNVKDNVIIKNKNILIPSIQEYNIITNQAYDQSLFKNIKVLKQAKIKEKKCDLSQYRKFNIISNQYWKDNDALSNQDTVKNLSQIQQLYNKYIEKNEYNIVKGECYDKNKEDEFQKKLVEKQKTHGKNIIDRLPPTYKFRESVIFDPSKPIPEEIKNIDRKKEMNLSRYKIRYNFEKEVKQRDYSNQDEKLRRIQQKLNEEKFFQPYEKGFDIINLNKIDSTNLKKFLNKSPELDDWSKINMSSSKYLNESMNRSANQFNNLTSNFEINPAISKQKNERLEKIENVQKSQPNEEKREEVETQGQLVLPDSKSVLSNTQTLDNDIFFKKSGNLIGPRGRVLLPKLENQTKTIQVQEKSKRIDLNNKQQYALISKPEIQQMPSEFRNKKDYLNDPQNVTLQIQSPRIIPQFMEPVKKIKSSGFDKLQ